MNTQIFTIHTLPLWFLVFSLLLPRLALGVYWLETAMTPFHVHGWLPLLFAVVLPRVLVLYLIYMDQGLSMWFVVHVVAAVVVWASSGRYSRRQRE